MILLVSKTSDFQIKSKKVKASHSLDGWMDGWMDGRMDENQTLGMMEPCLLFTEYEQIFSAEKCP